MPNSEQQKRFKYWQTRTIIGAMLGYALYYFVRKNFSLAMPGLEAEFGISKVQLGIFLSLNGVVYGLSRFINGFFADRVSARKMMVFGLALSAVANVCFGFSDMAVALFSGVSTGEKFVTALAVFMGLIWLINGYLQGFGVPPVSRLMTHWVPVKELATKMSIWNTSHSIGAGLVVVLCGFLMHKFGMSAWRLCFLVPSAIALIGAGLLWRVLRDTPSSVGLPEIKTPGKDNTQNELGEVNASEYRRFIRKHVFGNRLIWTLAAANFFVYVVRFAFLDWGPTMLSESRGISLASAAVMVAIFELAGGNIGMVVAGWATDKFFGSRAHRTCVVCMAGVILSTIVFWKMPESAPWWLQAIPFSLIGFFIYGPQALLGIATANQATKRAAASANGLLGIFGYASTIISGVGLGFVVQHYGWGSTFVFLTIVSAIGLAVLLTMWNAGSDGYAAAAATDEEARSKK